MTGFWCALDRDVVTVRGADASSYLQSQISQDIRDLGDGETTYTFVLQPMGKVDALARVHRVSATELMLDVEHGLGAALLARLKRFKIRVAADITLDTVAMVAVRRYEGQRPAAALPAWGRDDAFDVLGDDLPGGVDAGTDRDLLEARIDAGWPAMGHEITDATIPAETGVVDLAVSFTKGCYPGQELVERMDSRGSQAPRFVRRLRSEGDLALGAPVVHDGKEVGIVTSTVGSTALALVGRVVAAGDRVAVGIDAGSVTALVEQTR